MGIRWPWTRHTEGAPDEMAAASHAAAAAASGMPGADGPEVRLRLRYAGKVQAVGFRFQAQLLAQSLGVTGWVRNLDGGDVLLEVQGTAAQTKAFLRGVDDLSSSRDTWIDARLVDSAQVPCVQEKGFRVQY